MNEAEEVMPISDADIKKVKKWLGNGAINVFGPPFAGKDTQCQRLADKLGAKMISGGHIWRNKPGLPIESKESVDSGLLAEVDIYLKVISPYINDPKFANVPLLYNSIGRSHGEEKPIMELSEKSGHPIKLVILLEVSEAVTLARQQRAPILSDREQRADDRPAARQKRLDEYRNKTLPVLNFYKSLGLLKSVKGEGTVEEVEGQIWELLIQMSKVP